MTAPRDHCQNPFNDVRAMLYGLPLEAEVHRDGLVGGELLIEVCQDRAETRRARRLVDHMFD